MTIASMIARESRSTVRSAPPIGPAGFMTAVEQP